MAKKRIGILTGGGDVPGLNLAIKSVVMNGLEDGYEVIVSVVVGCLLDTISTTQTHENTSGI